MIRQRLLNALHATNRDLYPDICTTSYYDISPRKNIDQGDFLLKRAVRAVI